jgi:hypothetical protein
MRPFGHAVDLDLDFGRPDRPSLVTAVLAQCGDPGEAEYWWSQPVGERTAALLQLVALTEQRDDVSLSARCSDTACGESFEFGLSLGALPEPTTGDDPVRLQLDSSRALTVRRPTGDDLRRWREGRPQTRTDAVSAMLDSLVIAGQVALEDEAGVSSALAAADPLVDFTVSCRCPVCDAPNEVAVDLERLALSRLGSRQQAVLKDIHRLASHYGWTESEVMALPPGRRARYLAFIDEEHR